MIDQPRRRLPQVYCQTTPGGVHSLNTRVPGRRYATLRVALLRSSEGGLGVEYFGAGFPDVDELVVSAQSSTPSTWRAYWLGGGGAGGWGVVPASALRAYASAAGGRGGPKYKRSVKALAKLASNSLGGVGAGIYSIWHGSLRCT